MPKPKRKDTRRRLEQALRNLDCEANVLSAVHGVPMAEVAKREGADVKVGQSPFAIARGQRFERNLLEDNAAVLRAQLETAGVLPTDSKGFEDLRLGRQGGPCKNLGQAQKRTSILLERISKQKDSDNLPTIIAGATVSVPGDIMIPEALLVLDVLVVRPEVDPVELVVGEIKTYPDRGGHTKASELSTARAQAGAYIYGLRLVLDELGLGNKVSVSDRGFLVLTRPGSNRPSIRADEDLRYQALRAQRGFAALQQAARSIPSSLTSAEKISAVQASETSYCEACLDFCDRESACYTQAFQKRNPALLGEEAVRLLRDISLDRGVELLDGAYPRNIAEADLGRQLSRLRELLS